MIERYSDSTLMRMTKEQLIRQVRIAEHNKQVAEERLRQQEEHFEGMRPIIYAHWIDKTNPRWPAHSHDMCSSCLWWNTRDANIKRGNFYEKLRYCPNCGARMGGDDENG